MTPLEKLQSVLCDPAGKCCIRGSDEDRKIVDDALAQLASEQSLEDEIKRLRGIVPEILEELNDQMCEENERMAKRIAELGAQPIASRHKPVVRAGNPDLLRALDSLLNLSVPARPITSRQGPAATWQDTIKAAHPKSEPEFWPEALQNKYMEIEINALRAQLASGQEPVATVIKNGASREWMSERLGKFPDGIYSLYAHPAPEQQPLSKDQVLDLHKETEPLCSPRGANAAWAAAGSANAAWGTNAAWAALGLAKCIRLMNQNT
jgi:hypothetical protein